MSTIGCLHALEVSLTRKCNLQCKHCSIQDKAVEQSLSRTEIQAVINDARELGATMLDLTGGEPLLRSDLVEIVSDAASRAFTVKLLSNGTLLSLDHLKQLHDKGLAALAISVDGRTPEQHAKLRQTSAAQFAKTIASLEAAQTLHMPHKINTVIARCTIGNIPAISTLATELGCYEHRLCPLALAGRAQDWHEETLDSTIWLPILTQQLAPFTGRIAISVSMMHAPQIVAGKFAPACPLQERGWAHVDAEGWIYPCIALYFNHMPMGSVRDMPLIKLWHDEHLWQHMQETAQAICPTAGSEDPTSICPARKLPLTFFV